ncbi:hypothetical protein PtA15_5A776 [Puccinia triticina]|uniref:Fibronectin type-III domain-containing protein n=1 Tax=Puccinia triticina TaxID=208348 RepID=A0ABY7CMK3_9BASI|nr:uncharacterized protein PtA15_5A776 [Puccinia triticina]WAQ85202.1 hypothetical protein PtA15_5A776 [Puccinia triticina]
MASTGYTLAHPADLDGETSYTFTCGKIDAGIAVLIGSHAHLIEFPSLLLPPGCETGSIVSITCTRDNAAEKAQAESFWDLQTKIVNQFGQQSPQPPSLRLRSVTQTSVTLEWDKLELAQCKLLSLSMWKNGQRLGTLPNPLNNTSTKLSGLDLDSEYSFHLVMKTTGGSFNSQQIKVKTHSLNDTSGINVCFGVIVPEELKEQAKEAIQQLDGRWSDKIQIDTTHFVCTMPYQAQHGPNKTAQPNTFPSLEYQRALQLSIPVVQPSWLQACLHERKMVPIAAHYLGAQPPPLGTSPTTINSAGPFTRARSASKSNTQSSAPMSPGTVHEGGYNPAGPSGPSASGSRQHERANSAPALAAIPDTKDHVEKSSSAALSVIIENKDSDTVASQKENGTLAGTAYNPAQPSSSRDVHLVTPETTTESAASEKTLKVSTTLEQYALDHQQPHLPTPPTFTTGLSDILKENVDSPAENESSKTKGAPAEEEEAEPRAEDAGPSSTRGMHQLTAENSGLVDQSLAQLTSQDAPPTISNPSPLADRPGFSRSNSLNHAPFVGFLSPASSHLSPVIGPNPGHILAPVPDEPPPPGGPGQPLTPASLPDAPVPAASEAALAGPTMPESLAADAPLRPLAFGATPEDEPEEAADEKAGSGSGDTFFSSTSDALPAPDLPGGLPAPAPISPDGLALDQTNDSIDLRDFHDLSLADLPDHPTPPQPDT